MDKASRLCSKCEEFTISGPSLSCDPHLHHQTFEEFSVAVKQECFVCASIWHRLEDSPERSSVWKPMRYWLLKDNAGRSFYKLTVAYTDVPLQNKSIDSAEFRLVPLQRNSEQTGMFGDVVHSDTSSSSSMKTALNWFQSCRSNHTKCVKSSLQSGTWYPTRLIDTGLESSLLWNLCITAENGVSPPLAPYLTLSYRWGSQPRLLLLSSTIEQFRKGQSIEDLPRTFRDLVAVARLLSIRYIWIDALCIIQDSKEDWEIEALSMRRVYANSACTIAASAAVDEDGGLFRSRNPNSILPGIATLSRLPCEPRKFVIFERNYWDKNILAGPLHKRGWVFQERHLSPRVLYFANKQILWECFKEANCEGFPCGIPYYMSNKNLDALWDYIGESGTAARDSAGSLSMPRPVYFLWRDLVKSYSQCTFTKINDKFLAFSGIAKLFQEVTGDEYLAGLWRSRFLEGLDWRVYEPRYETSCEYRAPSWSWASVDGPLRPELRSAIFEDLVDLVEVKIQYRASDPTGAVLGGHLTIKGALIQARWSSLEDEDDCIISIGSHQARVRLYLDRLNTKLSEDQIIELIPLCSSLFESESGNSSEVVFLVLESDQGSHLRRHRRIGHFVLESQDGLEAFGLQSRDSRLIVLDSSQTISEVTII